MSEYRNRALAPEEDRLTCRACGFPGIKLPFSPAPTTDPIVTREGSVWMPTNDGTPPTAADYHVIDRRTSVVNPPGTCGFCGTNMPESARITWGSA